MFLQSILLPLVTITMVTANPSPPCELGKFLDGSTRRCTLCSQCQVNEIIREPCTMFKDTKCGPFYEFEFFNQGSSWSEEGKEDKDKSANLFKIQTTRGPGSPWLQTDSKVQSVGPSVQDETVRWKELCYGLITALVVLALVFAAYVIVAHIQISRLRAKAKAQTQDSTDKETVYCYTHMLPSCCDKSRGPKPPHPPPSAVGGGRPRVLTSIYRPGQARRAAAPRVRASPNEYVLQLGAKEEQVGVGEVQQQLLPIIPEGGVSSDMDHVRVLYTS